MARRFKTIMYALPWTYNDGEFPPILRKGAWALWWTRRQAERHRVDPRQVPRRVSVTIEESESDSEQLGEA